MDYIIFSLPTMSELGHVDTSLQGLAPTYLSDCRLVASDSFRCRLRLAVYFLELRLGLEIAVLVARLWNTVPMTLHHFHSSSISNWLNLTDC